MFKSREEMISIFEENPDLKERFEILLKNLPEGKRDELAMFVGEVAGKYATQILNSLAKSMNKISNA